MVSWTLIGENIVNGLGLPKHATSASGGQSVSILSLYFIQHHTIFIMYGK